MAETMGEGARPPTKLKFKRNWKSEKNVLNLLIRICWTLLMYVSKVKLNIATLNQLLSCFRYYVKWSVQLYSRTSILQHDASQCLTCFTSTSKRSPALLDAPSLYIKKWNCPRVPYLSPFVSIYIYIYLSLSLSLSLQVTAVNVKRALGSGKRSAANAERDCHRKFKKLGFSLPIAIRSVNHEIGKATYTSEWVKVSDWLSYFLRHMPSALGSATASFGAQCAEFWALFKHVHPSHELYSTDKRWDRSVPICLYGDEGRGPKRANFMDFSWETPFGVFDHTQCNCTCSSEVARAPQHAVPFGDQPDFPSGQCRFAKTLTTNQKAASYITKHLVFGLPSYIYKSHPHVLQMHLDLVASDMKQLYEDGIKVQGAEDIWYGVLIGIKGDQKFHAETAGEFSRSYASLGKTQELEMCSWCLAGPHPFAFEEVDHEPNWSQTQFSSRPWRNDTPPILSTIPFDASRPEYMFKFDMFHLLKVGMTRDVVGSLVVVLCRLGFFDDERDPRDLPSRLERAHGSFKLWCLQKKKISRTQVLYACFL